MDMGELLLVSQGESAVALDTGATADLVCFRWLAGHDRILEKYGIHGVPAYPSKTKFCFGDGLLGEVRNAADIPEGVAGI